MCVDKYMECFVVIGEFFFEVFDDICSIVFKLMLEEGG